MRKVLTTLTICSSIWLAGCATTGTGPASDGIDLGTTIAEIKKNTQFICNFIPGSDSALGVLISTFTSTVPGVSIGWTIADKICAAVNATTAKVGVSRGGVVSVVVNGVVVKGKKG